jgi:hypothetical protein
MRKERAAGKHPHDPTRSWPKLPHPRQFDDASAMFRALGEPSRLRLLTRLTTGEICVSELAELEDEKLTTISARLKTLHAAGLVKRGGKQNTSTTPFRTAMFWDWFKTPWSMLLKSNERSKHHDHVQREAPS